MNDLIPITDSQAEALKELAKTTGQAIEVVHDAGRWFAKVLGTFPEDVFGLLLGDGIRMRRAINAAIRVEEAKQILSARGVEGQPPPLELLPPLLEGAANTEQPELADLWAKLLAAAMDPARVGQVRREFIEAVKAMDPLDALLLDKIPNPVPNMEPDAPNYLSEQLGRGRDDVEVSLLHLIKLGIFRETTTRVGTPASHAGRVDHTSFGRVLVRLLKE